MAYLPPESLQGTTLPQAYGKDVALAIRVIEERYRLFNTQVSYYSLRKATDPAEGSSDLVGETTYTRFDPIYGESIDDELVTWDQPHNVDDIEATDVDIFDPPVLLYGRVRREAKDDELKRWGFDRIRDIVLYVPASLFDAAGLCAKAGDKFVWDGDEYSVLQETTEGWWKNSNARLFVVLNCEHRRQGS